MNLISFFKFLKYKVYLLLRNTLKEYTLFKYSKTHKCHLGSNLNFTGPLQNISIGIGTTINNNANFRFGNGKINIGSKCLIARGLTIITNAYELDNKKEISTDNMYSKDVSIGDNVLIGNAVTILPGVVVGSYSAIGAGSVVTKNIGEYEIWAGVPAKFIRKRNINE